MHLFCNIGVSYTLIRVVLSTGSESRYCLGSRKDGGEITDTVIVEKPTADRWIDTDRFATWSTLKTGSIFTDRVGYESTDRGEVKKPTADRWIDTDRLTT